MFYHGGMEDGKRTASQSKFMRGKVRICVATVAFGMVSSPENTGVWSVLSWVLVPRGGICLSF